MCVYIYIYIYMMMMMSSMTTNPPSAKRHRTTLQPATIEALEEERAEPIEIGTLVYNWI